VGLNLNHKEKRKGEGEKMGNNPNIGCVVVPVLFAMFVGLYFLSKIPEPVQWPVGVVLAVVLVGIVVFARFFRMSVSKR
jgi:hypothetical protein